MTLPVILPASLSLQEAALKEAESAGRVVAGGSASDFRKAAQEFSSLLFLEVLKAMRGAMPQEGLVENESLSRDIFTAMMDSEIAKVMARRDSTGFTQQVEKSLEKTAAQPNQPVRQPEELARGIISSGFGRRTDPLNGNVKFHEGVDIAVTAGTPVKSAGDGKVVFSGRVAGYGNLVEVDHGNGWVSRYGHNAANLVGAGDTVKAGQAIALVGSTGRSTGPHVHFEVRKEGKAVNPASLLGSATKGSRVSVII